MTHEDAGHYAAKHPQGTAPSAALETALAQQAESGTLSCAAAHRLCEELNLPPAEVGRGLDLMEIRLMKCQLGLFGYVPHKKIVTAADAVDEDLADQLRSALVDGALSCEKAWQLAASHGLKRMALAAACERLGIKIKPCQLGAF